MNERDDGLDKTDKAEDKRLAEQARKQSAQMPFYESEKPIYFVQIPPKE